MHVCIACGVQIYGTAVDGVNVGSIHERKQEG